MFGRKRNPVLTSTFCLQMEDIRLALEVLSGKRVRFQQIDFNTGRAKALIGEEEQSFSFWYGREDLIQLGLGYIKEWYTAIIDEPGKIRVIKNHDNDHKCGHWSMWWVGRSATDRWEEPLYLQQANHSAEIRGLSLEAFMRLESGETWPLEARVVIGNTELTQAQSATLRLAIDNMLVGLQDPKEREALGEIAQAYEDRLREIGNVFLKQMAKR